MFGGRRFPPFLFDPTPSRPQTVAEGPRPRALRGEAGTSPGDAALCAALCLPLRWPRAVWGALRLPWCGVTRWRLPRDGLGASEPDSTDLESGPHGVPAKLAHRVYSGVFFPTLICDFLLIVFFLAESPYIVLCDKLVLTGHLCFQR